MNKKVVAITFLICTLIFSLVASDAYAGHYGKAKDGHGGFESKIYRKAHFILKNKEELGLSDKQAKEIKDLKINTKKDLIRKKAEIDILALDIKTAMRKDPVDTDAVGKLIDKKYDLKKEKAKSAIGACAAIRSILTKEQKDKLKGLCKKFKKEMMHGSKKKGKGKYSMMCGER